MKFLGSLFKGIKSIVLGPANILDDWAREPLKRWENNRNNENKDLELKRKIQETEANSRAEIEKAQALSKQKIAELEADTELKIKEATEIARRNSETKLNEEKVRSQIELDRQNKLSKIKLEEQETIQNIELNKEKTLSEIRMAEQVHEADLAIRMQTEVVRINHETEQWVKDKEFERLNNINEAIIRYKKELSDIQMNIIKVVNDMSIELWDKAQNLIIEKTQQYQAIQKQAIDDAEVIFDRIETKYADKPRIYDSMIKSNEKILSNVIDNTTEFMSELKIELQNMSKSIDQTKQNGQEFINKQIGSYSKLTGKLESGTPNYAISNE